MKKFKILIPKKHNKGAAMISIMLAVAFISIVTSAMLLISLNNYEMKLTQAKSKKNFYYNEKYINIVTSVARSEAKGDQSPETKIKAKMCTNSTDNQYKAYKIMDILEPGVDHSTSQSGNKCIATLPDGNQVTTYDGNVKVYDKNNPVYFWFGCGIGRCNC